MYDKQPVYLVSKPEYATVVKNSRNPQSRIPQRETTEGKQQPVYLVSKLEYETVVINTHAILKTHTHQRVMSTPYIFCITLD